MDGRGSHLVDPSESRALLRASGFEDVALEDTGARCLAGYKEAMEKAEHAALPPLGLHSLLGEGALHKTRNAARNIEEGRIPFW